MNHDAKIKPFTRKGFIICFIEFQNCKKRFRNSIS